MIGYRPLTLYARHLLQRAKNDWERWVLPCLHSPNDVAGASRYHRIQYLHSATSADYRPLLAARIFDIYCASTECAQYENTLCACMYLSSKMTRDGRSKRFDNHAAIIALEPSILRAIEHRQPVCADDFIHNTILSSEHRDTAMVVASNIYATDLGSQLPAHLIALLAIRAATGELLHTGSKFIPVTGVAPADFLMNILRGRLKRHQQLIDAARARAPRLHVHQSVGSALSSSFLHIEFSYEDDI